MIDRNIAKELCIMCQRPENCNALEVLKINKELWNTTSLAQTTKDRYKMYQTVQKYINHGVILLVQLIENMLNDNNLDKNFRLARGNACVLTTILYT